MREKMTIREAILFCKKKLDKIYDENESMAIAETLLTFLLQTDKIYLKLHLSEKPESPLEEKLEPILERLGNREPLQYIINEAWFDNERYVLNKNVLIPRPETEELLYLVCENEKHFKGKLIDFGTGSGCLAISLKKHFPDAGVYGIDISIDALETAKTNAGNILKEFSLGTPKNPGIHFIQKNILDKEVLMDLPDVGLIVSNPPYIGIKEKEKMHENVWKFEPAQALFAPEGDELIFYKAILDYAEKKLYPDGKIYLEINPLYAKETEKVFSEKKYKTVLRKDMQGKERFLIAEKTVN